MYLFPNVNMQDLNLDWILNQIKQMAESISRQEANNTASLALTKEQSTLMEGFLEYFPEGTFEWTKNEEGIITSITVVNGIENTVETLCNTWMSTQGQSITEALNQVNRAKLEAESAANTATAASQNYLSSYDALQAALTLLHALNNNLDSAYTFQYLDYSNPVTGKNYVYNENTNKVDIADYEGYMIYPVIYNIPKGTYTFDSLYSTIPANLSHGATFLVDVETGDVHMLSEWTSATYGTIYVPFNFDLYASTTNNPANPIFITNVNTVENPIFGMYKYGISEIDDLKYDFTFRKQYLRLSEGSTVRGYYSLNSGRISKVLNNGNYTMLPPVYNLKAGTYSFRYLYGAYSFVEHDGVIQTLNAFTGIDISFSSNQGAGYTFVANTDFTLLPTTSPNAAFGTGSPPVSAYFINGDRTELPPLLLEGVYKNTFTDMVSAVSHVDAIAASVDTTPLYMQKTCYTVGHMGNQIVAPRNTAPAYIAARKMGCMAGENDVRVTSDGVFVMYHGDELTYANKNGTSNLVTLTGKDIYVKSGVYYYKDGDNYYTLENNTLTELDSPTLVNGSSISLSTTPYDIVKKISFGACFSEDFTNTPILTLSEYALLSKKLGLYMNLDLKLPHDSTVLTNICNTVALAGMLKGTRWGTIGDLRDTLRAFDPQAIISVGLDSITTDSGFTTAINTWKPYNTNYNVIFSTQGTYENGEAVINSDAIKRVQAAGFQVSGFIIQSGLTDEQYKTVMKALVDAGVISITCDNHTVSELYEDLLT